MSLLRRTFVLLVLAVGLEATAPVAEQPGQRPRRKGVDAGLSQAEVPRNPPALPELARQLLRRRMERHGKDAPVLWTAVTLLQRDVVAELATNIASEPRLVRPTFGHTDELNTQLPERFFVLQDVVRDRAKALAQAARGGSDEELAQAFGRLAETCVACHSAFLVPRAE
jgi:hypothetical protein